MGLVSAAMPPPLSHASAPTAADGHLVLERGDLLDSGALAEGAADDGARFDVTDPASGDHLAQVRDGDRALALHALDTAASAFESWAATPIEARAEILRAWHGRVTDHREDLARLVTLESGKPLRESRAEVEYAASYITWFAEEAEHASDELLAWRPDGSSQRVVKEPVGVTAVVTPWNFPLAMVARKAAPALVAGCTVLVKPAEDTPLSALALARLAWEAGLPPGALSVVPASRPRAPEVVGAWLEDERVRKLSFTGSTAVGRKLAQRSAATLKRLSLELGGDAPFIIFSDADLDTAMAALMTAKFRNAGQTCVAANRILVEHSVYDRVIERLRELVGDLTVGPAADGEFDLGPLINPAAATKVAELVRRAQGQGANLLAGGPDHLGGAFFAPTLLEGVRPSMEIARHEVFAPVLPVIGFQDEAEGLAVANASSYGLAAYVCTGDAARADRMAAALQAGMVAINEGVVSSAKAPFGGVKQSGYGREGSVHGLAEYQSLKYVRRGPWQGGPSA
jgi:succinate-semialdehyde dehydrogenase/glutarate-semialdehyde dehydrogenase